MKKLMSFFFGSLFIVLLASNLQAQVSLGIKAGASLSEVRLQNNLLDLVGANDIFEPIAGFHGGLSLHTPVAEDFQLVSELIYSQKGFKATAPFITEANATTTFHYLSLPVMLFFEPVDQLSVGVGAEAGYLLNAQAKAAGVSLDISDAWREVDFGLNFGIKFDATEDLWIEGRYTLGLSPLVRDGTGLPIDSALKVSNRAAQLAVGYRIY